MEHHTRFASGLASAALAVTIGALSSSAEQQQRPPFRATTEVVSVDVVVTGRDGAPMRGLAAEDFVVRHEGATLDVAAVDEIGLPTDARHNPPLQKDGARVVARSTALDAGRLILVVLDDAFVRFEGGVANRVRRIGEALVDGMAPHDQAAIVTASGRRQYHVDFTSDTDVLRQAIVAFARAAEAPIPREFAARVAGDTFRTAVELFAAVPHRRKVLALVSDGTAVSPQLTTGVNVEDTMRAISDLQQLIDESSEAGVTVYVFDPSSTEHRNFLTRNRLRALAELTGGRAYAGMNHPERGVTQMLSETAGYYTLRVYSPAPGREVTPRVTLASRHAGAEVRLLRQRQGGRQDLEGLAAATATGTLAGGLVALGGLPVRLTAVPASGDGSADGAAAPVGTDAANGRRSLALTIDLAASVVSGWTDVAVQAIAVDGVGTVRAGRQVGGPVAALPLVEGQWVRLETSLAVAPGRYQVRVVAARGGVEATARTAEDVGSVFAYVSVP